MTPQRWHEIKAAFEAVDSAPPGDRLAMLDRLCAGNDSLRRDLETLLRSHDCAPDIEDVVGSAANLALEPRELIGRILGPYRIDHLIGAGGMGEVYAAEDPRLGRQVALKLLPAAYAANPDRIRRFQQEARAASALNHPNIVTIYDFGHADGHYYMATEIVLGKTLRATLADGPLPARQIAQIGVQISGALAAAHDTTIVHRDIKPENIMIRPDGYVKVLDFGLAKLREPTGAPGHEVMTATKTGTIMGTAAYMSPEQVRGLAVSGQSDVFSLGVVLYEMVCGQTPFRGKSGADQIAALLEHRPPPLRTLIPSVPASLEAIIDKCLQKDTAKRYQTAHELLADLRVFQQEIDSQLSTTAATAAARPAAWHKWFLPAAAALIIALGAFAAARYFLRQPAWFETTRFSKIPSEDRSGAALLSPSGRYLIYGVNTPDSRTSIHVRQLHSAQSLEVVAPTKDHHYGIAIPPDEAFLYYTVDTLVKPEDNALYRVPLLGGPAQKILDDVHGISFSPNGSRFAFVRGKPGDATLWTADSEGGQLRSAASSIASRAFYCFTWSADGRELVYSEGIRSPAGFVWTLRAVSATGGTSRVVATTPKTPVMALHRLPGNSGFAALATDSESNLPQIFRISPNGVFSRITHDLIEYQGLSVTQDGKRIATNQAERLSEIQVIDANDASSAKAITDPNRRFGEPVWPAGKALAGILYASGGTSNLWAMTSDGGDKHPLAVPGSLSETEPSGCPDRDEMVFTSRRGDAMNLWLARPAANEVKQLTFAINDHYPQCLAGGKVIYRSQVGSQLKTMQVSLNGGDPIEVSDVSWENVISPDSSMFITESTDPVTHIGRKTVKTRQGNQTLVAFDSDNSAAAWEPNGRGIAHVFTKDGRTEVWYQPLNGGAPRKMTRVGGRMIFWVNWSPDGRHLVCAVGRISTALILIDDVR